MMSESSAGQVVSVQGLSKAYQSGGTTVQALQDLGFEAPAGEILAFLGPNGAGKTTAIRILAGFLAADEGRAEVCGFDVARDPLEVQRRLGYLPEHNPLYLDLRVEDFLRFAGQARGLKGPALHRAIDRVVAQTGLAEVYRRRLGACSKGFRQRAGLAQALLHDPELLILDEPTNGLDPVQVVEMRRLVRELGREKTVILTTHVLPEVEALADRVVLLRAGRKVVDGPLTELQAPSDGLVQVALAAQIDAARLEEAVTAAGGRWLGPRPAPFALDGLHAGLVELDDAAALPAFSAALQQADVLPLQLAPQGGPLESWFLDAEAAR
jgi:ABC-2 type transport system ATP-binding protein